MPRKYRLPKHSDAAHTHQQAFTIIARHSLAPRLCAFSWLTCKDEAILIFISCGQHRRAIELLLVLERPATAALFLNACVAAGALQQGPTFEDQPEPQPSSVFSASFATRVFTAYARHLQALGLDVPSSRLHYAAIAIDAL